MNRKRVLLLSGMILLALGAIAYADTAARVRIDIPFDFYAGTELMPQGQYTFEIGAMNSASASGSSVLISNDSGSTAAWLFTMPETALGGDARLVFNHYGEKYFLASVEGAGFRASLRMTKAEKETRAQGVQKHTTTLVAVN